ncbi:MAG TPA: GPW/gp25 family protein [Rhodanobacter sp.]|nr:GPW/gp25 family protein [Rhodanobacter sp.]
MRGMDRTTGKPLDGLAHLQQSIGDILSTPVGSRVMRRDYGSLLPRLVDQPFHAATRIRLYAAVATALMRWEPRLRLSRVSLDLGEQPGQVVVTLEGVRTDIPVAQPGSITVPLSLSAVL